MGPRKIFYLTFGLASIALALFLFVRFNHSPRVDTRPVSAKPPPQDPAEPADEPAEPQPKTATTDVPASPPSYHVRRQEAANFSQSLSPGQQGELSDEIRKIGADRQRLDKTVWAKETAAQGYEQVFVRLWDDLLNSTDKYAVLGAFDFLETIKIGKMIKTEVHDWDIRITEFGAGGRDYSADAWRAYLADWKGRGFQIIQTEWHHKKFNAGSRSEKRSSIVSFEIHAMKKEAQERFIIKGDIEVEWSGKMNKNNHVTPRMIDASKLTIIERKGRPAFETKAIWETGFVPPILVYDINRDGLSDIIFPGTNERFTNQGDWKFKKEALTAFPPEGSVNIGILADFTGDGIADYIAAARNSYLQLFVGDTEGRFSTAAKSIKSTKAPLENPQALTAGDIDGDGDLDIWIGQYKISTDGGASLIPYYDANDGYRSFLLLNVGGGNFKDVTEAAGLASKRFRRVYSSSLVDLDDDRDLDLLVVSDFSGVDIYHNDGRGNFTDVTSSAVEERSAFGMGHSFADYNLDGKMDVYVIGMSSTTARRLDYMGLGRKEFPKYQKMRAAMTFGNRMYLGTGTEKLVAPSFKDSVARAGWCWGATSFDFDNDGDWDIYVANGMRSGKSVRDYCTRFWTHDVYVKNKVPNIAFGIFSVNVHKKIGPVWSWNGYEHNRLYMNNSGKGFMNVSFLMDVAYEFDSRAIVSDDLDMDGRPDLLVVKHRFKVNRNHASLHLVANVWPTKNNWIGIRLAEEGNGWSPIGARATIHVDDGRKLVTRFVNGDSVSSQHADTKHFGLGKAARVKMIEVEWLNGSKKIIKNPAINRYHYIRPPDGAN